MPTGLVLRKGRSKEHAENLKLKPNTEKQLLIQLHKHSQ